MGKILDAIASDRFCVAQEIYQGSMEYRKARDRYCILGDQLLERLDEEDKKLFQDYSDAQLHESILHGDAQFVRGFRVGALMMMEVLTDVEEFILHEEDEPE